MGNNIFYTIVCVCEKYLELYYSAKEIQALIVEEVPFKTFFERANLHKNAYLITGTICGYKIQDIENPLTKSIRYLDKLVEELARGKKMEKILRSTL